MADRKISDLTALTTPASGDFLPIVDISEAAAASKNKRITIEELMRGVPNGTAAAPGIAFETDPNTGIYSPGADQLAISTNGTGRLFVDASGNVGVKIASPSSQVLGAAASSTVAVTGASGGSVLVLQNDQGTVSTNARIELNGVSSGGNPRQISYIESLQTAATGAGALVFGTHSGAVVVAATERLRITSAGLVGIGTSAPQAKFEVAGDAVIGTDNAGLVEFTSLGVPFFAVAADASNYRSTRINIVSAGGWADLSFDAIGTAPKTGLPSAGSLAGSIMYLDASAQRVGIGDTAPDALLTVNGVVSHGAGSASAPSIAARGDLNTGAFFPAADTFGVATGGTEALRITNDRVIAYNQPTPTSKSAAATLTITELKTGIIQYTGAVATLTLPTGTLMEGGFSGIYTNMAFEWSAINTGAGICTVAAGTDHTVIGSGTVAIGASARFASRRTAANTFVSYRLS